jgi:hypothetical protein
MFLVSSALATQNTSQQKTVKKIEDRPVDFFSRKKMELIKELDDIMREMIWLIRSQRPTANKTLFGKTYRALQQAKGTKLTEKSKHSCDQYAFEKVTQYQYRVFEHCQKHRAPDLLAKIEWAHKSVNFQFQGQNYADVLGVAASLVAPVVDCQVKLEDEAKLVEFQCTGFRITRGDNVVRFDSIIYRKGKDPMMYLKGEVLRNMLPFSDITISVPLAGKVKIFEKKKVPDLDEVTPEQQKKLNAKQKHQDIPAGVPQPLDPRKIDGPIQGGEAPPPVESSVPLVDPSKPPRETEADESNPNNNLLKNSVPDVIEIQESPSTR